MEKYNIVYLVSPLRIIKAAHNDSIISFSYLESSNLLISTSIDSTIKYWYY
jgi:hypothetical protein